MKYYRVLIVFMVMLSCANAFGYADRRKQRTHAPKFEAVVSVDPDVNLSLCLNSGRIRIKGWNRNEVRASSDDLTAVELRRFGVAGNASPAKNVTVVPSDQRSRLSTPCLDHGEIEIHVPRRATVKLQTQAGEISITDVAKVYVAALSGDVKLERVTQVIDARAIGGNISVSSSSGQIKLRTVGGSIDATDVKAARPGDTCEVSTVGGGITVELASFSQLTASSVHGSLSMSGVLIRGGRYAFSTISGDVNLTLPADSSFRLTATLSRGAKIDSDFPLTSGREKLLSSPAAPVHEARRPNSSNRTVPEPHVRGDQTHTVKRRADFQQINTVFGTGEAVVTISSFNGALMLRKN